MTKGRKRPSPHPTAESGPKPFEIRFTEDAGAEIKKLDGSVRAQLKKVLEKKLALDPEAYGLPLRSPLTNYWKHEFADHRIVYRIYPEQRFVVVCATGPRRQGDAADIYRQLTAVVKTGRLAAQVAEVFETFLKK